LLFSRQSDGGLLDDDPMARLEEKQRYLRWVVSIVIR
jgi:hypothetical protein